MLDLLKGVRVIDLTTVVLGPYATQMLGDLGADVIKVEAPEGDVFRHVAPQRNAGMGAGFLNLNRNKRSVCLDLKSDDGRERFRSLVESADVVVHNMRPKAASRLALDYASLSAINPSIVYCAAVGFGAQGPYADKPAYDDIVQAAAGLASLATDSQGAPRFIPTVIGDKVAALFAIQGILAGLFQRERTGEGVAVEAPMFESMANFLLAEHMSERVFNGQGQAGYARLMSEHRRPYATLDGYIAVMPYTTKHWTKALKLIGHDELIHAEWVVQPGQRSARIGELYELLGKVLPGRTSEHWLSVFGAQDIPCTPVNRLDDLFEDAHLAAVGFFRSIAHSSEGFLVGTRYPLSFQGARERADEPAPSLGEHNDQVE